MLKVIQGVMLGLRYKKLIDQLIKNSSPKTKGEEVYVDPARAKEGFYCVDPPGWNGPV